MTFEEETAINKTIAEFCEYKDVSLRLVAEGTGLDSYILSSGVIGEGGCAVPEYTRDLNAMYNAEKHLIQHELGDVYWTLYEKILDNMFLGSLLCIPSRAKAEVFVKVLKHLKEDEN